jgi:hypothetical protein
VKMHILAMGQDLYWLTAIQKAIAALPSLVSSRKAGAKLLQDLSQLPHPNDRTVLLVDASGQINIGSAVEGLRVQGWEYIIVVAADPSAKQAISVLRGGNLAYDYWDKTYDDGKIRDLIKACIEDILKQKKAPKKETGAAPEY